jgi:hypothetical protein
MRRGGGLFLDAFVGVSEFGANNVKNRIREVAARNSFA